MSIERRALSGAVAGAVNFGLVVAQNLLLVPMFLGAWGAERYGLWLSLLAAQSVLQTIDTGHQGYVGNEINRAAHSNRAEFATVVGSGLVVAMGLGLLQLLLVLGLIASGLLSTVLGLKALGAASSAGVELALIILVAGWGLTGAIGGILVRILAPLGLYSRSVWWGIGMRGAQIAALALGVGAGLNIVWVAALYTAAGCAGALLLWRDAYRRLRQAEVPRLRIDLRVGLRNLGKSLVMCANGLVEQIGGNGLILLIGHSLSIATVPVFTTLRTLANTAMQASGILLQPVATDLVRYQVERRGRQLNQTLAVGWLVCGTLVNALMIGCLPVVPWLYSWWVRGQIPFDRTAFIFFIWMVAQKNIGAPLNAYLVNNNRLTFMSTSTITRNGLILCLGLIGLKVAGVRGLAAALAGAETVSSLLLPWWFARKELAAMGADFSAEMMKLAVFEQLVLGLLVTLYVLLPGYAGVAAVSVAILLALVLARRWRVLDEETRSRLGRLLSFA